jgi:hypothetical protein
MSKETQGCHLLTGAGLGFKNEGKQHQETTSKIPSNTSPHVLPLQVRALDLKNEAEQSWL